MFQLTYTRRRTYVQTFLRSFFADIGKLSLYSREVHIITFNRRITYSSVFYPARSSSSSFVILRRRRSFSRVSSRSWHTCTLVCEKKGGKKMPTRTGGCSPMVFFIVLYITYAMYRYIMRYGV